MADSDPDRADAKDGGWRQIVAGGGLLAAVAVVLVVAAILETPEAPARAGLEAAPRTSQDEVGEPDPPPPGETPEPGWKPASGPAVALAEEVSPEPSVSEDPVLDALSRRVLEDPMRIRKSAGRYTAQLAFVCRRETAERLVERAAGSSELYVLAEVRDGKDCFRVCWGAYASREEATSSAGLPSALRDGLGRPEAKRIAELIP